MSKASPAYPGNHGDRWVSLNVSKFALCLEIRHSSVLAASSSLATFLYTAGPPV